MVYIFNILLEIMWNICHTHSPSLSGVHVYEVIDWDFYTFSLFKFPQRGHKQLKVKSSRKVKVIVVMGCQSLFLWRQNLQMGNIKVACLITGGVTQTPKRSQSCPTTICALTAVQGMLLYSDHINYDIWGLVLIY